MNPFFMKLLPVFPVIGLSLSFKDNYLELNLAMMLKRKLRLNVPLTVNGRNISIFMYLIFECTKHMYLSVPSTCVHVVLLSPCVTCKSMKSKNNVLS